MTDLPKSTGMLKSDYERERTTERCGAPLQRFPWHIEYNHLPAPLPQAMHTAKAEIIAGEN